MCCKEDITMLDHLIAIAPMFNKMTALDLSFTVSDREKVLVYEKASTLDLGAKPGDILKDGTAIKLCMEKRQRVIREVDRKLFGVPYIAVAYPIIHNGEVIGAVSVAESLDKKERFYNMASNLAKAIEKISASIQQIASEAQELSATSQELSAVSMQAAEEVKNTDNILQVIRRIADQTNLIGLNAAIEAARVGEYGRGFTVVAEEVRKLAQSSSQSTVKINEILTSVQEATEKINNLVLDVSQVSEQQAHEMSTLSAALEELKSLSVEMEKIAQEMTKDAHQH
ncbi:MAG: methyl-accepting chemotaxis protein [Bacillota bacterium]